MAAGDIETFHRNGIWFNRIEGESQTLGSSFMSEAEAVKVGRSAAVARQVEHTVRTDEGPSVDSFSYDLHPRELIGR
ncbi:MULTISPECIES: hypothetical protein [Microbacterium]|jgi:hypothetical protein|uniref:hypothetical protein n=1 Tax=Microbacterium TaxID=33882 RepID=UPI00070117C1|nr:MULTISPECIES: hypothetical protein [Microbacterium]KQV02999.1 hypothetical protein ASC55_12285 [Microbacterium sp. Root322]WKT90681.1 hypothetical protein QYR02_07065 [Microbacterium liquefaciens]